MLSFQNRDLSGKSGKHSLSACTRENREHEAFLPYDFLRIQSGAFQGNDNLISVSLNTKSEIHGRKSIFTG